MSKHTIRTRFVGIIGNISEHYDNAFFGLLAPFVASFFFESSDPLTALILTYRDAAARYFIPTSRLAVLWLDERPLWEETRIVHFFDRHGSGDSDDGLSAHICHSGCSVSNYARIVRVIAKFLRCRRKCRGRCFSTGTYRRTQRKEHDEQPV